MSMVMWDMLTGGAPFREVLGRLLNPVLFFGFLWNLLLSLFDHDSGAQPARAVIPPQAAEDTFDPQTLVTDARDPSVLGRIYEDGETIFHKGEAGDCMFVIQEGQVEVIEEMDDQEVRLAVNGVGDVIGEMALFERQARSATVRALGRARVLTVDERTFMRYVHQDPSIAFQLLRIMSNRVRRLNAEVAQLKVGQR
jgi:hypothetical protein